MDKKRLLFVDEEEEYLMTLVLKFIECLDEKIDITIITDTMYLNQYLNEPHEVDILIINDTLYDKRFERFGINDVYCLTEDENNVNQTQGTGNTIYKYSSTGHIYKKIVTMSGLDRLSTTDSHTGRLLVLYSPIGGSGKTYASIGIARALTELNKKVLYINVEKIQDFGYFLKGTEYAGNDFERAMMSQSEDLTEVLKSIIQTDDFDYIPPFEKASTMFSIHTECYEQLIRKIRELEVYDFILLETSKEFTQENVFYMGNAERVLIITNQDPCSVYKLERFLANIDYTQSDRFKIICNAYDEKKENALLSKGQPKNYEVLEYIRKEIKNIDIDETLSRYSENGFQRIAYYLV